MIVKNLNKLTHTELSEFESSITEFDVENFESVFGKRAGIPKQSLKLSSPMLTKYTIKEEETESLPNDDDD
jgi:hypothetical protein